MPAKNSVKQYLENGFYHLYNRGVEKREIFLDDQDYAVFLSYLKEYLLPKDTNQLQLTLSSSESSYKEKDRAAKLLRLKNFSEEIELLCYCLVANHFHLLVKQDHSDGIDRFLNSLGTRYALYFNRKYHREGRLYQGVYRAVLVQTDEQLLHLSRYIHLNAKGNSRLPCSLPEYYQLRHAAWVKPSLILNYFSQATPNNTYASFMGENPDWEFVAPLAIDY